MSEERFAELIKSFRKISTLKPDIHRQYLYNITQSMSYDEIKEMYRFFSVIQAHLNEEVWR